MIRRTTENIKLANWSFECGVLLGNFVFEKKINSICLRGITSGLYYTRYFTINILLSSESFKTYYYFTRFVCWSKMKSRLRLHHSDAFKYFISAIFHLVYPNKSILFKLSPNTFLLLDIHEHYVTSEMVTRKSRLV